jgi:hypothetical protein
MTYKYPIIGDNKVVYKGKRYWVIEFTGKQGIEGFDKAFCQFIMYDKLEGAIIATVKIQCGIFKASLVSHVELTYSFKDLKSLTQNVPSLFNQYCNYCYR